MSKQETPSEVDERLQVLENRTLYQDRTIEELNDVVTKQQDQMDVLTTEVKRLRELLESAEQDGIDGGEEPPPPHY